MLCYVYYMQCEAGMCICAIYARIVSKCENICFTDDTIYTNRVHDARLQADYVHMRYTMW